MNTIEINSKDREEIDYYAAEFLKFASTENNSASFQDITPHTIDQVFTDGRDAYRQGQVSAEHVCWVCGFGFGEYLRAKYLCHWVGVEHAEGTTLALKSDNSSWLTFPVDSFFKRIDTEEHDFVKSIVYMIDSNKSLILRDE